MLFRSRTRASIRTQRCEPHGYRTDILRPRTGAMTSGDAGESNNRQPYAHQSSDSRTAVGAEVGINNITPFASLLVSVSREERKMKYCLRAPKRQSWFESLQGGAERNRCKWLKKKGKKRNGVPGGTRTPNLLVRSQALYPIELRVRCCGKREYTSMRRRKKSTR